MQEVLELENLNLQVSDLTFLTRMKKLRCLSLRSNKGSDDKLTEFVCGLKNIINLNIAGAPVTNKVIKKIVKMPNLRFFGIENTLIDDEGIAALAPAHIELLEIGGLAGRVTDRSMKLLAKFKHLHKLIVHKSKWITDKGMNEFRESVRDRVLVIEIP